jgi:hypothetical protein
MRMSREQHHDVPRRRESVEELKDRVDRMCDAVAEQIRAADRYVEADTPPVVWLTPSTLVLTLKRDHLGTGEAETAFHRVCLTVTPQEVVLTGMMADAPVRFVVTRGDLSRTPETDRLCVVYGDDLSSNVFLRNRAIRDDFRIGAFQTTEEPGMTLAIRGARTLLADPDLMGLVAMLTHGYARLRAQLAEAPEMGQTEIRMLANIFDSGLLAIVNDPRLADGSPHPTRDRILIACEG